MSREFISPHMSPAPWDDPRFKPTPADRKLYGEYAVDMTALTPRPDDIPEEYVAYNPSSIWTVDSPEGSVDVLYVRVEPNRSDPTSSHLGKAAVKPYIIDSNNPEQPLVPFDTAETMIGEDAALTKVKRTLANGQLEDAWVLSYVDAQPDPDIPNHVSTLRTRFYIGQSLDTLEHFADGPEWMKDIRIAPGQGPLGTEVEVFGRPQLRTIADNGNISHTTLQRIEDLSTETIASAPIINEDLLPVGSGVWGGVNDVVHIDAHDYILAAHRAWRTGESGHGRHYEALLYGYNTQTRRIVELGVLATAADFKDGIVKEDSETNLTDVVFTGGAYNGTLRYMTYGVSDGNIGFSKIRKIS